MGVKVAIAVAFVASFLCIVAITARCGVDEPTRAVQPATTAPVAVAKPKVAVVAAIDAAVDAYEKTAADLAEETAAKKLDPVATRFAALIKVDSVRFTTVEPFTITVPDIDHACSYRRLLRMRDQARDAGLSLRLFDAMECEGGDEISLRTSTGCKPDQWDEMILTDEGRAREDWTKQLSDFTFKNSLVVVVAVGCDATTLSPDSIGGGCNEDKLRDLAHESAAIFRAHGFKRLACGPGPGFVDL